MTKAFYLTAAIPYVNGQAHLGHVLEWFQADAIARYHRLLGKEVAFTCGTDENSLKNVQAAAKAGVEIQTWLDDYSQRFKSTFDQLNISLTHWQRGSDQILHWPGVQELWRRCDQAGAIYKKAYTGLYCLGCESFVTPDELIDGNCPEHNQPPEEVSEENYFFSLSNYQDQIKQLLATDQLKIYSDQYKQEMLGFIEQGLEDFSISRSLNRAKGVGVPVPSDDTQVMYVWFDALMIYLTAIGFGTNQHWQWYWPADVHVIGKGINRFHSIYWIGMLLAAGLQLPKAISVHGYITVEGTKMSKSLSNIIEPLSLIEELGLEPVRYYLLKAIPTFSDGEFSRERFVEIYTADLANGIGNLCSRVAKMASQVALVGGQTPTTFDPAFTRLMDAYQLDQAAGWVIEQVALVDQFLSETQPWKLFGEDKERVIAKARDRVISIAFHLQPFMPKTVKQILTHFASSKIEPLKPLFPRLT